MKDLPTFLLNTGRTLSQMALYSPEHPAVKESVAEAHRLLAELLTELEEITISFNEAKLLVNGRIIEGVPEASTRPFLQLLAKFDLHSLSFIPGITAAEMIPFFRLASKGDIRKTDKGLSEFLETQGVTHIKVNQAKYAKIGEDETVGGIGGVGGEGGAGTGQGQGDDSVWQGVEDLSLNELIRKLIGRAVVDPAEQAKIFQHALNLVKGEIEQTVKRVTAEFGRERMQLTNERERVEGVVGALAEGVVVVDQEGKVLMMNPAAENLYGVKLKDTLGKTLSEKIREEQMMTLAKDLSIPTDRPIVKEVELTADPETRKTLRASAAAIQDPQGRIVGLVSVLSDVTKQKELNRLQNEFMANVTHELRTPMHAIKLAVEAILEGTAGKTTPEQEKMLGLAGRNVDRLSRLIDDLLDFSQVESGAMRIHPHDVDLGPLLSEAVQSLDGWAKSRSVILTLEDVKDVPHVFADADRVLQVTVNLISNAIKFTPASARVTVRAKPVVENRKNMIRVEVEDSGKGIPPEDQKRIFSKFVQLEQTDKTDIRGTGLGLSICQALIELHKGKITVESPPPGKPNGSLFAFTLPLDKPVASSASVAQPRAVATPAAPSSKKGFWKKVLSKIGLSMFVVLVLAGSVMARPRWGTVRRVLNGDLIQLKDGSLVRYLGIEAPKVGTPYYVDALSANKRWVENKEVRLQYGLQERNIKGEWLAYVYVDGVMVNRELVREGMALLSPLPNEEKDLVELLEGEREAQSKERGLWKDVVIDPYPVRKQKQSGLPWATSDEIKRGIKK